MNRFAILRADSFDRASQMLREERFSLPVVKAGGMDIVDHLKEGLIEPDALVDVLGAEGGTRAPIQELRDASGGRLRFSALTTLAEIASSELVRGRFPALAQSADSAATPQVRNVATSAGNLLQRPRCWYYRSHDFHCLKKGGDRCYAIRGLNRYHAIFGEGPCHIVHPSNLAVPLMVARGVVHVTGAGRETIPIEDLFHMPDVGVRSEHTLRAGEVITAISCSSVPASAFCAVKEKQSFDWPLVMCACALELDGDRIAQARVCAGAVAPVPWRLPQVERALEGVAVDDRGGIERACESAGEGARPMRENAYKVHLLRVCTARAVRKALGQEEI